MATGPSGEEVIPTAATIHQQVGRKPREDVMLLGMTLVRRDAAYKQFIQKLDAYQRAVGGIERGEGYSAEKSNGVSTALRNLVKHLETHAKAGPRDVGQMMERQLLHFRAELSMLEMLGTSPQDQGQDLGTARARLRAKAEPLFQLAALQGTPLNFRNAEGAMMHGLSLSLMNECATVDASKPMTKLGSGSINTVYQARVRLADGSWFPRDAKAKAVYKADLVPQAEFPEVAAAAGISSHRPNMSLRNVITWKLDRLLDIGVTPETHLVLKGREIGSIMAFAPGVPPLSMGDRELHELPEEAIKTLRQRPELLGVLAKTFGFKSADLQGNTLRLVNGSVPGGGTAEDELDIVVNPQPSLNSIDFGNPRVRCEITKMEWFDALTGQCDRNPQNYFVDVRKDGSVQVTTIDNDVAFGGAPSMRDANTRPGAYSPSRLPDVIDRKTATALMNLTHSQLEACCHGLDPDEISATMARLAQIQAKVRFLEGRGLVIDSDMRWSSVEVGDALGIPSMEEFAAIPRDHNYARSIQALQSRAAASSYVARERSTQIQSRMGSLPVPELDLEKIEGAVLMMDGP